MVRGYLQSVVEQLALSTVKSIMAEHKVGAADFRDNKRPQFVKARAAAIRRLSADGLSEICISEIMRINPRTVAYWLRPSDRARRIASRIADYHRKRA